MMSQKREASRKERKKEVENSPFQRLKAEPNQGRLSTELTVVAGRTSRSLAQTFSRFLRLPRNSSDFPFTRYESSSASLMTKLKQRGRQQQQQRQQQQHSSLLVELDCT